MILTSSDCYPSSVIINQHKNKGFKKVSKLKHERSHNAKILEKQNRAVPSYSDIYRLVALRPQYHELSLNVSLGEDWCKSSPLPPGTMGTLSQLSCLSLPSNLRSGHIKRTKSNTRELLNITVAGSLLTGRTTLLHRMI